MPTYVITRDALNKSVSCFKNCRTPSGPVAINLLAWFGSAKHRDKIEHLRTIKDKAVRDELKVTILPAITPSGLFTYREESAMMPGSHTHLLQFDIDLKDNLHIRNYAALKPILAKLPFVLYCGLSASGKGYWGLVYIAYPERHAEHFDALVRVFKHYKINIDPATRNVASQRTYSYDPAPHMPDRAMVFELCDEAPKAKPRDFAPTSDADTERTRVEVCIKEVLQRGTYLGDSYSEWYEVGCSLANEFGESGRDYFDCLSRNYPSYQASQTDKQFTACLKGNSKATLATFYHACKQIGIEWKNLLPLPERTGSRPQPPVVPRPVAEGLVVTTDEDYPADWDTPPDADAVPTLRAVPCGSVREFHQWQQQHPFFSKMGLSSLPPEKQAALLTRSTPAPG